MRTLSRTDMQSVTRGIRIAVLIFYGVWFNAVVPGHTRGAVTLPDTGRSIHSCCGEEASASKQTQNRNAPGKRAARCAVCFFAAHQVPAAGFDSVPRYLGQASIVPIPVYRVPILPSAIASYDGRAPPL